MNVLIHSNRKELDRNLNPVDYEKLAELKRRWGGNVGNKLFLTAVDSYCRQENVEVEYLSDDMSPEYINDRFDLIIWPLANCFQDSETIMGYLADYTKRISKYRVPVLALGAGAQAQSYDDINSLSDSIKETSCAFIDAVHATGGVFGLRGYFTKELFEKWGYREDWVTGCPSMYQMGRNLQISKPQIDKKDIRMALNGSSNSLRIYRKNHIYEEYPESWFIDQGDYVPLLYDRKYEKKLSVRDIRRLMTQYSRLGMDLLADNRIVCIYDLPRLAKYIQELEINFSFGQRIHGNILCTLLGIPSVVFCCDSRTKELAEFFDIPIFQSNNNERIAPLEIYEQSNWEDFNKNFVNKYDMFERLLVEYRLPPISKKDSSFLNNSDQYGMPSFQNDYTYLTRLMKNEILWLGRT